MYTESFYKKSFLAGLLIAFGGIFSIYTAQYGPLVQGLCFSLGLTGVLLCDAKLFTGSMLSIQDYWEHKTSLKNLIKMWGKIWWYNLIGTMVLSGLVCYLSIPEYSPLVKVNSSVYELVAKGFLCNILICMAVWIFRRSNKTVLSAVFVSLLPVACFVTCGFEHCVADMFYMTLSWGLYNITAAQCFYVIFWATMGNIIGGIFFSWLVYDKNDIFAIKP